MKRSEKDNGRFIEEIIWGVPSCSMLIAPLRLLRLTNSQFKPRYWSTSGKRISRFKLRPERERSIFTSQASALPCKCRYHSVNFPDNQRPVKKRKVRDEKEVQENVEMNADPFIDHDGDYNMEAGMDMGMGMQDDPFMDAPVDYDAGRQRSSEEPGQGRQFSRQSSITRAQFGLDVEEPGSQSQSQKSSLFPWDNAGFLSSSSGAGLPDGGTDRVSVERADVRIRGSSVSRTREDSLVPSQAGSVAMSPGFDKGLQMEEDYRFQGASFSRVGVNT